MMQERCLRRSEVGKGEVNEIFNIPENIYLETLNNEFKRVSKVIRILGKAGEQRVLDFLTQKKYL